VSEAYADVGRRGGKARVMGLVAGWLAVLRTGGRLRSWTETLIRTGNGAVRCRITKQGQKRQLWVESRPPNRVPSV
jgi:hypothetical protein